MKKMALIFSFLFVLAIVGYAGESKAADSAYIVNHVIDKGVKKQGCGKETYEFVYDVESADGFVEKVVFTVVHKEKKVKVTKKYQDTVTEDSLFITIFKKQSVPVFVGKDEVGKTIVEVSVSLEDSNADGKVDKLSYKKTEAGKVLEEVNFDKGILIVKGATENLIKYWTPTGVQDYFNRKTKELHDMLETQ